MIILAGKCASLAELAKSSSVYRKLAGGTQWVKAPTAAPPSVLTAAYAWNSTAPLLPRTPDSWPAASWMMPWD